MNLLSQTMLLAPALEEGGAAHAPVVAPDTGAGGVFDLLWLVIALPLLGAFLLLAVAAAEAAIGLAIVIAVFRSRGTVNVEEIRTMKY